MTLWYSWRCYIPYRPPAGHASHTLPDHPRFLTSAAGPRIANALTMLMFAPPVFLFSIVTDATGFQAVRLFIGMSLCCFVCCQYWVGSMFNVRIVGSANGIAAGW